VLIPEAGVRKAASFDVHERFKRGPWANLPRWDGTPVDYPRAIEALCQADAR